MLHSLRTALLACTGVFLAAPGVDAQTRWQFEDLAPPVGVGAREPNLALAPDGSLLLSWMERNAEVTAVRMARFVDGTWQAPETITISEDLFVNWADFPSVAAFADGTLVAHWLQSTQRFSYDYDVSLSFSDGSGNGWSTPFAPYADNTEAQHGFVSLLPIGPDIMAVWLDGRAYDGASMEPGAIVDGMQLRTTTLSPDGQITQDTALDFMTCSCCQTAAALAGDDLLVVYRDRTEAEIRDISLVALRDGVWSDPQPVHDDGWELSGCPVNGPAIDARDAEVIVAWFTAANDEPSVQIAFSSDAGVTFSDAARIDGGAPEGRVDADMLDDGRALVSWLEWSGTEEVLFLCEVNANGCDAPQVVATNPNGGSMNFPRMVALGDTIFLALTYPMPDGTDTIRVLRSTE